MIGENGLKRRLDQYRYFRNGAFNTKRASAASIDMQCELRIADRPSVSVILIVLHTFMASPRALTMGPPRPLSFTGFILPSVVSAIAAIIMPSQIIPRAPISIACLNCESPAASIQCGVIADRVPVRDRWWTQRNQAQPKPILRMFLRLQIVHERRRSQVMSAPDSERLSL